MRGIKSFCKTFLPALKWNNKNIFSRRKFSFDKEILETSDVYGMVEFQDDDELNEIKTTQDYYDCEIQAILVIDRLMGVLSDHVMNFLLKRYLLLKVLQSIY
jgi:hypothetical protein